MSLGTGHLISVGMPPLGVAREIVSNGFIAAYISTDGESSVGLRVTSERGGYFDFSVAWNLPLSVNTVVAHEPVSQIILSAMLQHCELPSRLTGRQYGGIFSTELSSNACERLSSRLSWNTTAGNSSGWRCAHTGNVVMRRP